MAGSGTDHDSRARPVPAPPRRPRAAEIRPFAEGSPARVRDGSSAVVIILPGRPPSAVPQARGRLEIPVGPKALQVPAAQWGARPR